MPQATIEGYLGSLKDPRIRSTRKSGLAVTTSVDWYLRSEVQTGEGKIKNIEFMVVCSKEWSNEKRVDEME